jgi:hypothetical protein
MVGSETLSLVISDTHGFYLPKHYRNIINVNDTPIQIQALPSLEIDEDHPG